MCSWPTIDRPIRACSSWIRSRALMNGLACYLPTVGPCSCMVSSTSSMLSDDPRLGGKDWLVDGSGTRFRYIAPEPTKVVSLGQHF